MITKLAYWWISRTSRAEAEAKPEPEILPPERPMITMLSSRSEEACGVRRFNLSGKASDQRRTRPFHARLAGRGEQESKAGVLPPQGEDRAGAEDLAALEPRSEDHPLALSPVSDGGAFFLKHRDEEGVVYNQLTMGGGHD